MKLPKRIIISLYMLLMLIALLTLFRLIFGLIFYNEFSALTSNFIIKSFFLGLRFDLRLVVLIIFPYLLFIIISSVFVGTLNAKNKFALGAGLPIILNLAIILSIVSFPVFGEAKIIFLSWSVIVGGAIQSLFLFVAVDKTFWKVFFSFQ